MSTRSLVILTGRAASGKSEYLFEKLKAHADRGESAILLTEEQSTYEAEKALCARYGGLLGTQVLSVSRFCQLVLEEAGVPLDYLSPQGRCMVLRKIAAAHKKELRLFSRAADRRGFAAEADELINRLSKNAVSPEDLSGAAAGLEAGALKDKLADLTLLYRETELFLADKYLTEYSLLERAQACLAGSGLARSHIYVDSADLTGERAFRFLGALLDECLSMTVTVLLDDGNEAEPLFAPGVALRDKLRALAAEKGISCLEVNKQPDGKGEPALVHLEKYLYREKTEPFPASQKALFFTGCTDRTEEVELLCERIADLTENGTHYKDIAVTLTDKEAYLPLIRRAFRRRGIPIFEDAPRSLSSHAAADLLLSAARFAANGSMDDVLHIVKSDLADVTREEAEQFENHVLRYGLYGSALFKPFAGKEVPPEAETARQKLAEPLRVLKDELAGPDRTARARVESLYRYLTALQVSEKLRKSAADLQQAGENGEAQLLSEVWARLMEVLGQIYRILDTDTVSLKELPGLLEEGIFATSLSPLPGNQDRVTVGDMDRSRNPQRDILFVLGANEGLLPPKRSDDGLFSDRELNRLAEGGLTLWEDTEKEMARDRVAVYTVLTKARRILYITYAQSMDGEELPPSALKDKLCVLFPALKDVPDEKPEYPTFTEGAFEKTLWDLVLFLDHETPGEKFSERYAYFSAKEPYASILKKAAERRKTDGRTLCLDRKLAGEVYGQVRRVSASQLETFNRCPFEHYMQYGLRAKERKEFREEASDAGTFLHNVLDEFIKRASASDPDMRSVTDAQAGALIDRIVTELTATHNFGIYERDPVMKASLFLQTECAKRCALAILTQIRSGDFRPYETEYAFGYPDSETPGLTVPMADGDAMLLFGKIDRIDRSQDGRFIRIVDYKLGGKKFEANKLEAGTLLQLPLYLMAVRSLGGQIAGLYYMPLQLSPNREGEEKINMLTGVTNATEDAIQATEHGMDKRSSIIDALSRNKDGLSQNALMPDELEALAQYAVSRAGETGREIRAGHMGIKPYEGSCDYCPYGSVCRFSLGDADYGYRALKKDRKFRDLIGGEEEKA